MAGNALREIVEASEREVQRKWGVVGEGVDMACSGRCSTWMRGERNKGRGNRNWSS